MIHSEYLNSNRILQEAAIDYYNGEVSLLSDSLYDQLYNELVQYEKENPDKIDLNSITNKVGAVVTSKLEKSPLSSKMLSLNNAFTVSDLEVWFNNIKQSLSEKGFTLQPDDADFAVEYKVDGLALELHYVKGAFVKAITRGNGEIGELVTEQARMIKNIPLVLNDEVDLIIRGEVYIDRKDFDSINEERKQLGQPLFMNPRNLASGTIRSLDTSVVAKRKLKFCAYFLESSNIDSQELDHIEQLGLLNNKYKFKVPSLCLSGFYRCSFNSIIFSINKLNDKNALSTMRGNIPFNIDGLVIKYNNRKNWGHIGTTSKYPKYAIAFKFKASQQETILKSVDWQVGRTGIITPVANLDTVEIDGSNVSRATLHNIDMISALSLQINDTVVVQKAAEIIPEIVSCSKNPDSIDIQIPTSCPSCESVLVTKPNLVGLFCENKECPEKVINKIKYFVKTLKIDNLGDVIIEKLCESRVNNCEDIFSLTIDDLTSLDRVGFPLATKIIDNIKSKKELDFATLLTAFGIPGIGSSLAKKLSSVYNFDSFMEIEQGELMKHEGIAEKLSSQILDYITLNKDRLYAIRNCVQIIEKQSLQNDFITSKVFCITGTLSIKRDELVSMIEKNGGIITGSVTNKTDYLVCGENAGSKLEKAQKLKIPVLTEAGILDKLNN